MHKAIGIFKYLCIPVLLLPILMCVSLYSDPDLCRSILWDSPSAVFVSVEIFLTRCLSPAGGHTFSPNLMLTHTQSKMFHPALEIFKNSGWFYKLRERSCVIGGCPCCWWSLVASKMAPALRLSRRLMLDALWFW